MKRLVILLALITSVSISPRAASAGPVTYDQTNPFNCPNFPGINTNICQSFNPAYRGNVQTFTPLASALDYFELWVQDAHDDAQNSDSMTQLVIRDPLNAIIGTAQTSVANRGAVSAPFMITFTFASPVGLTPGKIHSWQFLVPGGDTEGLAIFGTALDLYPGGTGFSAGSDTGGDWFFAEGLQTPGGAVPEPATLSLVAIGLAASLFRRSRQSRA